MRREHRKSAAAPSGRSVRAASPARTPVAASCGRWEGRAAAALLPRRGARGRSSPRPRPARRLHGRHRRRRPAARHERLRKPGRQAVPPGGDGRRRRVLRLRPRRLARHLPRERDEPRPRRPRPPAPELPLPQQPRRHVHRRHGEGGPHPFRLGTGLLRRRLRQRRLRRPLRHLLGEERPLPQQRRRHVHGRLREGRGRGLARPVGRRLLLPRLRP